MPKPSNSAAALRAGRALLVATALAPSLAAAAPGTGRPLVVIDPGHGGSNRGACVPQLGVCEHRVTLQLARRIARQLRAAGVDVKLTRDRDRYLTLQQRVRLANRWRARLFLSVHFNASETHGQRGFESFVLAPGSAANEAERMLRRPSAEGASGGSAVDAIVGDLAQRDLQRRSLRLAQRIQRRIAAARLGAPDRGVRQGSFDVLLGLRVPGVLVEAGFLDHPDEGREIVRPRAQRRIAAGIAQAITSWLRREGTLTGAVSAR